MKKLISFVSATVAMLFASVTFAQQGTTTVQIPAEGKLCFEVVRGATADPNPANHAECGDVSDPTLAKIKTLTARLNKLRGRVDVLEQRVDQVEVTANQASQKADLAVSGVLKTTRLVYRLGEVVEQRVGEVEQSQAALVTNMGFIDANDAKQDRAIADIKKDMKEIKQDVKETKQDVNDLKASGNRLTLSASWLLLGGTNSKYAAPLVSPGLSLGLGPKSSLNIDLGLTANKSGGKTSMGTAVKVGLAYNLDVVTISAGWATYALGLDRTSDAMAIKSGLEVGIMKEFGSARIFLNVMPGGVDYAVGLVPGYALGANAGAGYAF